MKEYSAFRYFIFFLFLIIALFAIRRAGLSFPVAITTSEVSSELSVVGEGKVDVVPDTSYVDISVVVSGAGSAAEAQSQITSKNNAIVAAMKALGIKEEGIKTSNFSVTPNYVYDNGQSNVKGYNGNASLSVKTTDFSLTPRIIETATKVGANEIQSTRFVVDNPEKYREQARDKAIANARDQASKLASSLGIVLGKVTNVTEASPYTPPIYFAEKSMAAGGGAPATADLKPGTQTITSTVTLYFEKR